jgi:uncharacterized protein (TIGR00255 family)
MTGHGAAYRQQGGLAVSVELRTVNNRYYKLALRISDGYALLESRIDELVRQKIRRGTVQIDVRIDREVASDSFRFNEAVLAGYFRQLEQVQRKLQMTEPPQLAPLLGLPGVVDERSGTFSDVETIWPFVEQTIVGALDGLSRMREEEGRAMASDLAENCRSVAAELDCVEQLAPRVVEAYRQRLTEKLTVKSGCLRSVPTCPRRSCG